MNHNHCQNHLGVIICKYCKTILDTVDTEMAITYYSVCPHTDCAEKKIQGVINDED